MHTYLNYSNFKSVKAGHRLGEISKQDCEEWVCSLGADNRNAK
jgi:hypothetical protein